MLNEDWYFAAFVATPGVPGAQRLESRAGAGAAGGEQRLPVSPLPPPRVRKNDWHGHGVLLNRTRSQDGFPACGLLVAYGTRNLKHDVLSTLFLLFCCVHSGLMRS